jgi:hypothetical protein
MRNLLAFLMALILTVGGLGYYLDWFKVRTSPSTDGHTTLNIDWNSLKFYQDTAKAGAKVTEMLEKNAKDEQTKTDAEKVKAKADAEKNQTKRDSSGIE